MSGLILPNLVVVFAAGFFFFAERAWPGRELPTSPGWMLRALTFNLLSMAILTGIGLLFDEFFRDLSLLNFQCPMLVRILTGWVMWSFVFYWWHRAVHLNGLWHLFHQMHHSPSRIEVLTTFFKHPLESVAETLLTSVLLYLVLGLSPVEGAWVGAFVACTGFLSHGNLRTPKWLGYLLQRPEQHSIHHQIDLHRHNYSDFIVWDRIFGTFQEAEGFAERCGFPGENERRVSEMLLFKDVYK